MHDALKMFDSIVEIVGGRIVVGEAGALVNRMNQMRAVLSGIAADFRIEGGGDHSQSVVGSEGADGAVWLSCARCVPGA